MPYSYTPYKRTYRATARSRPQYRSKATRSVYTRPKRRQILRKKALKRKNKPSVSRAVGTYTDQMVAKLKMHWMQLGPYNAYNIGNNANSNTIMRIRMNAGGTTQTGTPSLGQPFLQYGTGSGVTSIGTTAFLNWENFANRYNYCRPMGCKVTVRFSIPDSYEELVPNVPLAFGIFPYLYSAGGPYSNEWDETSSAEEFKLEKIGTMKYGTVKKFYGAGSKSYVTYSKYFSFAKLAGRSYEQYCSDPNFAYNTTADNSSPNPLQAIYLAILPIDFTPDQVRLYNMEINITQYVKFESSRLTIQYIE